MGELYTERKEPGKDSLPILSVSIHTGISDGELDEENLGKTVRRSEDKSTYKHVYAGDLVFNMMRAWQGAIGSAPSEGMISPAYISAVPNEKVYPPFMNYYVKRKAMIEQINSLSYGVTDFRKRLYWDSFIRVKCMLPSFEEQKRIAGTLKKYDGIIAVQEKELERLYYFKKGMLQKMFPKEGVSVPEIRFPGFTSPWEQRKLGELAVFNPKAKLPDVFEYVDLESVVGTEMLSHRTESRKTAPSRAQRLAETGDLFYQTVRPYQKNNYLFEKSDKHYVFSTGYAQMRPVVDGRFLFCLVQNDGFVKDVLDNCTGTSYPAINSNALAEIDVYSPVDPQEQKLIGDFFKGIDALITIHQCEYNKWKELKNGLLQQMFV